MEYITKILPDWLQAYLLHGSEQLFDEGEKEIVDKFIADNKLGECVDCIKLTEEEADNLTFDELNFTLQFSSYYWVAKFIFKTLA